MILDTIEAALGAAGTAEEVARTVNEFERSCPFEYAMVGDTLSWFAEKAAEVPKPAAIKRLRERVMPTIATRLQSLGNWSQDGNQTVEAIRSGLIDPRSVKPHVRAEKSVYDEYYQEQEAQFERDKSPAADGVWAEEPARPIHLGGNINHAVRKTHALSVIEMLFGVWGRSRKATIRWIDIGCGRGHITNGVKPARFAANSWEIIGADFQAAKIRFAEAERAQGRQFVAMDAMELLEKSQRAGVTYDFVSMFEFLEHLDDPLCFLRRLAVFEPRFVIAASPLGQRIGLPHLCDVDRIHFWSFTRRSFEQMLKLAGFEAVYSSEVRIGKYIGGLDWLTVVSGPREELKNKRHAALDIGREDVPDKSP